MKTLIGHLSQFSVLSKQGEVLCTQGLHFVLESKSLKQAFESQILQAAEFKTDGELTWHTEVRQTDGGRPDLEARSPNGRAIIKIEAKLHAAFGTNQLASYSESLGQSSEGSLLIVLVPKHRVADAEDSILKAGFKGLNPFNSVSAPSVCSAIVTWESVFDCLRAVDSQFAQGDLRQLEGLYRTVVGDYIEPISSSSVLKQWRIRDDFFANIVDRVTRKLWELQGEAKVAPLSDFKNNGYLLRYVPVKEWHINKSTHAPRTRSWLQFSASKVPVKSQKAVFFGKKWQILPAAKGGVSSWISLCKPLVFSGLRVVGGEGLEPSTNALKGRCSTIELPTRCSTSAR